MMTKIKIKEIGIYDDLWRFDFHSDTTQLKNIVTVLLTKFLGLMIYICQRLYLFCTFSPQQVIGTSPSPVKIKMWLKKYLMIKVTWTKKNTLNHNWHSMVMVNWF